MQLIEINHDHVRPFADFNRADFLSSPRARAPSMVAMRRTLRGRQNFRSMRPFLQQGRRAHFRKHVEPVVAGAPSAPSETEIPRSNISRRAPMPEPSFKFDDGQCATLVFVLHSVSISSVSR